MLRDLIDDKPTLVQKMAWCHQTPKFDMLVHFGNGVLTRRGRVTYMSIRHIRTQFCEISIKFKRFHLRIWKCRLEMEGISSRPQCIHEWFMSTMSTAWWTQQISFTKIQFEKFLAKYRVCCSGIKVSNDLKLLRDLLCTNPSTIGVKIEIIKTCIFEFGIIWIFDEKKTFFALFCNFASLNLSYLRSYRKLYSWQAPASRATTQIKTGKRGGSNVGRRWPQDKNRYYFVECTHDSAL